VLPCIFFPKFGTAGDSSQAFGLAASLVSQRGPPSAVFPQAE